MPEFLTLLPPDLAREKLLAALSRLERACVIETSSALGRVVADDVLAPHSLPEFPRSTVDGYAVRARDTFGASDSLPGYLKQIGEVPMGASPRFEIRPGECALIHTGGMLPPGADAVVMLEYTQPAGEEIEILRAVADGENLIRVGEDVQQGQVVVRRGTLLRPAEIGGLMALGITELRVVIRPRIGLISSGDEVIPADQTPAPGQVRDINAHTLAALVQRAGGEARFYGIQPDRFEALQAAARQALEECDAVVITAGSSASTRDITAQVIDSLGTPGVLVHGINTKPGKPTILGACDGKAVIGLPGNPVSALVNGYLFLVPVIEKLLGLPMDRPRPTLLARLTLNLASQAGREDWWPVRLFSALQPGERGENWLAEPIFGKSNLIFTLVAADGLIKIPPDATGLSAGETVEVFLM
ncbi:MAG: molybdopterin molybdotransferase MoeA [Anaerolineales bacterium]|nr:molybdopterin molybdotransferase MoeA [Anaerolineales bacterium]MCX7756182.1 molybdopterin molybdotransferase MoeA [Anaerolineales bacterium]MDW8276916.1 molybdopterin molybdotransferase MoeA [Anaerolineales bacterium]